MNDSSTHASQHSHSPERILWPLILITCTSWPWFGLVNGLGEIEMGSRLKEEADLILPLSYVVTVGISLRSPFVLPCFNIFKGY